MVWLTGQAPARLPHSGGHSHHSNCNPSYSFDKTAVAAPEGNGPEPIGPRFVHHSGHPHPHYSFDRLLWPRQRVLGRCLHSRPHFIDHPCHTHPHYSFGRLLWPRLRVLGRCLPSDKHLLVTALQRLRMQQQQQREGGGGGGRWRQQQQQQQKDGGGRGGRQQQRRPSPWGAPMPDSLQQEVVAMTGTTHECQCG